MASTNTYDGVDASRSLTGVESGSGWSAMRDIMLAILKPLASLKITVVLFVMAIIIVLAGTLAQTEKDIWQVVDEYFRMDFSSLSAAIGSSYAWIDFRILLPQSFFPNIEPIPWGYGFAFPKGWLIGLALFINLTAAHVVSFRIQGSGRQLVTGLALILLGSALTVFVILSGSHQTADLPPLFVEWPSLRILWLLVECTVASLVLLLGCFLVFHKRAGIVLLHAGIGLMMVSELITGMHAREAQMQIVEGETVNYVMDTRELELALIDHSDATHDDVLAIPQSRLLSGRRISDESLPVDVELVEYFPNSTLRDVQPSDTNLATAGRGLSEIAIPAPLVTGTDSSDRSNNPAAYVRFFDRQSGESLGTYLLALRNWMLGRSETLEVGSQTYALQLRYLHEYKPYSMHLIDVEQQVYMGTQTARSYASELRLVDPEKGVDREVRIWMNNPLRYDGSTFYQSNYGMAGGGREYTGLQVVTNAGWRIPYVSCMIVSWGMLAQFLISLRRYLARRGEQRAASDESMWESQTSARNAASVWSWLLPSAVVFVSALWLLSKASPETVPPSQIDYTAFGQLPVTFEGRVKPFDTLARSSLRRISDRQTYVDADGERQPATRWLLDVITDTEAARAHKVFRIHNLDLLETLGLKRRAGFRYAINEFANRLDVFEEQVRRARSMSAENRDPYALKILDLDRRLNEFLMLQEAFRVPQLRMNEQLKEDVEREARRLARLESFPLPLAIPPQAEDEPWQSYTVALFDAFRKRLIASQGQDGGEPNPAVLAFSHVLDAYDASGANASSFNQNVVEYQKLLDKMAPAGWEPAKTRFEVFFNHAAPLFYCMILYGFAFVLGCLAWLDQSGVPRVRGRGGLNVLLSVMNWFHATPLKRAATWLCAFTLVVHTLALIGRMYISGRPPVTTLYTSTLFVGWACVLLGLIMERFSKIGVANVVAAATGFLALLVGYKLTTSVVSFQGDTFTVLVAVLDTNFWLATHVTCIAAGYSATFLAGLLGITYVVRGLFTPSLTPPLGKNIARMIYGTVCFAIFFSFFGTVLGGLWADDSWGRFWGWDPKENGALIIVLWNAVTLHALWGRLVGDRGLALLAIFGNVVTAWSWFGVNELGVGLHSYGFTEGVLFFLGLWMGAQLLLIACGLIPQRLWISHLVREGQPEPSLAKS